MPLFFMDKWYLILVLPALLISIWAQIKVKSTFAKYGKIGTRSGMNGRDACVAIQQINGIHVPVESVQGSMTDHYDPRSNVIRLSQTVGPVNSIAALQYAEGYGPIRVRAAILPTTQFATSVSPWLVFAGLMFQYTILAYLGVILFGTAVLFQLITLPVEFNASARALRALETQGILSGEELAGAKKVLSAAALTYVAALLVYLMNFLRLLLIVSGRGRRND